MPTVLSTRALVSVAGLYVHVPFQRAPHTYEDGYAVDVDTADPSQYVTALCRELRMQANTYTARETTRTLYAGGGRPSLLPLGSVHSLLRTFVDVFAPTTLEEATAEVHPADATPDYLHGLQRMGIDRLSLPVLSFFPSDLRAIDAAHTAQDAIQALRRARTAGFDNLSIDLLFGWPEQSLSDWKAVLQLAVGLGIPHVTLIEADSQLGPVASDEALAHRLEVAMRFLQSEGYDQYELTHFARDGYHSLHQEHYYAHENQIGVGPSAESFWWPRRRRDGQAQRWANVADLDEYVRLLSEGASPVAYRETLDRIELAEEYVLLRLRTRAGLNLTRLANRYGFDLQAEHGEVLARLHDNGLIHRDDERLRLTNRGVLVADAIARRLLPSS